MLFAINSGRGGKPGMGVGGSAVGCITGIGVVISSTVNSSMIVGVCRDEVVGMKSVGDSTVGSGAQAANGMMIIKIIKVRRPFFILSPFKEQ
jgi:hypothetical protein